jgi:DNA-binding HxlR family transcriptional regulator
MPLTNENVYAGLKRIFHEPSRLAIMSALCSAVDGLTFNELKEECDLSFGNLSSHLKTLQDAGVIAIKKSFVKNKPRTTAFITDAGRESFIEYLKALEDALKKAAQAVSTDKASVPFPLPGLKPAQT